MAKRSGGLRRCPSYEVVSPSEPGGWWQIRSEALGQPLRVRIKRLGSRVAVVGLEVDNGRPVTAADLRSIKFPEILDAIFDDSTPADWWREVAGVEIPQGKARPAKKGTPPSDDQLQAFARLYLEERARHPSRAMTTTTKRFKMARSTGYRWLEECRQRGLLPKEER